MNEFQFTSPYYPRSSTQFAGANPVSILPRQSTSVQVTHQQSGWGNSSSNIGPTDANSGPTGAPGQTTRRKSRVKQFDLDTNLPSGPAYYHARRKAWLTPAVEGQRNAAAVAEREEASTSARRISELLSADGAIESEEVWNKGLKALWRGLLTGNRLKKPLPLNIVIKILHAGWIRDGTWPPGAVMPDTDEEVPPPTQTTAPIARFTSNGRHVAPTRRHAAQPQLLRVTNEPPVQDPNGELSGEEEEGDADETMEATPAQMQR